jgi:predicted HTH domain antitoxin
MAACFRVTKEWKEKVRAEYNTLLSADKTQKRELIIQHYRSDLDTLFKLSEYSHRLK